MGPHEPSSSYPKQSFGSWKTSEASSIGKQSRGRMADAVRGCRVTVCDRGHSFDAVQERTCAVRALMRPALTGVVVAAGRHGTGDASIGETGDMEEAGVLRETTLVFVGHWLEREGREERTGRA